MSILRKNPSVERYTISSKLDVEFEKRTVDPTHPVSTICRLIRRRSSLLPFLPTQKVLGEWYGFDCSILADDETDDRFKWAIVVADDNVILIDGYRGTYETVVFSNNSPILHRQNLYVGITVHRRALPFNICGFLVTNAGSSYPTFAALYGADADRDTCDRPKVELYETVDVERIGSVTIASARGTMTDKQLLFVIDHTDNNRIITVTDKGEINIPVTVDSEFMLTVKEYKINE